MTKVLLTGACGAMGKKIADVIGKKDNIKIVCGVDRLGEMADFPIYSDFSSIDTEIDVIIDFSHISVLDSLLKFATNKKIPAVIATTGFSTEDIEKIKAASRIIPIFFTANMSLGVNLLCALSIKAASVLGDDFDIEIIEKHHNQKIDAPSGTALMLANAVNSAFGDSYIYEYDRHSKRAKRKKKEIGIHSIRGGTIVGEHDVIFAGRDETITLSHTATSKEVFAVGAVKAALFLKDKPEGLYDMTDILSL